MSAPQASMKSAAPLRPMPASASTAGIHTKAVPPAGRSEKSAASTPNTMGEGRPVTAKPMAVSAPWMSAVRPEP